MSKPPAAALSAVPMSLSLQGLAADSGAGGSLHTTWSPGVHPLSHSQHPQLDYLVHPKGTMLLTLRPSLFPLPPLSQFQLTS